MSMRNFRKVCGGPQLPPPDDTSDEDYDPPCARSENRSGYAGLVVSSNSESDHGPPSEDEEPEASSSKTVDEKSRKLKKQKKKKARKAKDKIAIDPKLYEELDEIDRSLLEVNAELGEPEVPPEEEPEVDELKEMRRIFTVRQQHMHANDELDRKFGPDDSKEPKKRMRLPKLRFVAQKGYIINTDKIFKKQGLTMSLVRREKDVRYFAFNHSKEYQDIHRRFLFAQHNQLSNVMVPADDPNSDMHVEALLEVVDRVYELEEYKLGNRLVEDIIAFMQQSSHPFFTITDVRTRLEYSYVENRAFHIAMLKHMHMLTNKACHRTSLEMAKILLNLDPSDPLAVLFVIDTIALRAREHKWLIQAIDYWKRERNAEYLFTMQYSYALAHFQVARKEKAVEDAKNGRPRMQVIKDRENREMAILYGWKLTLKRLDRERDERKALRRNTEGARFDKSNELIKNAMLRYPTVVTRIFENAGIRSARVKESPLFNAEADKLMSTNLKDLIYFYGRFVWNKFSEDVVSQWLVRNAEQLAEEYEKDPAVREQAKTYANIRMNLFQCLPIELIRHLSIISSLNNAMFDGAAPNVGKHSSFDPEPPLDSINRNRYNEDPLPGEDASRTVFELFNSLLPTNENNDVPMRQFTDIPVHQARSGFNDMESDSESDFSDYGPSEPGPVMVANPGALLEWPIPDDDPILSSGDPLSVAVRRLVMHMINGAYMGDDPDDEHSLEEERAHIHRMLFEIRQREEERQSDEETERNRGARYLEIIQAVTNASSSPPPEPYLRHPTIDPISFNGMISDQDMATAAASEGNLRDTASGENVSPPSETEEEGFDSRSDDFDSSPIAIQYREICRAADESLEEMRYRIFGPENQDLPRLDVDGCHTLMGPVFEAQVREITVPEEESFGSRFANIYQAAMEGDTSSALGTQVVGNQYRAVGCFFTLCNVISGLDSNEHRDPGAEDSINNEQANDPQDVDLLPSDEDESDIDGMDDRDADDHDGHVDYNVNDFVGSDDEEMDGSFEDREMAEEQEQDGDDGEGAAVQEDDDTSVEGDQLPQVQNVGRQVGQAAHSMEQDHAANDEAPAAEAGMQLDRERAVEDNQRVVCRPYENIRSLQDAMGAVYEMNVDFRYQAINPTPDVFMYIFQVTGNSQREQQPRSQQQQSSDAQEQELVGQQQGDYAVQQQAGVLQDAEIQDDEIAAKGQDDETGDHNGDQRHQNLAENQAMSEL